MRNDRFENFNRHRDIPVIDCESCFVEGCADLGPDGLISGGPLLTKLLVAVKFQKWAVS